MAGPSGSTPVLGLPFPTPDDNVDVPRDVGALAAAIDPLGHVPVGAVLMWPTAIAPAGWLPMSGQQVSAAAYPGLAALFGSTGGNVTIPDMRDMFPVGSGASYGVLATGGAASVALSIAQLPGHNHGGLTGARDRSQNHGHSVGGGSNFLALDIAGGLFTAAAGNRQGIGTSTSADATDPADHLHSIPYQGSNSAHENRPPYRALQFIIRAG